MCETLEFICKGKPFISIQHIVMHSQEKCAKLAPLGVQQLPTGTVLLKGQLFLTGQLQKDKFIILE